MHEVGKLLNVTQIVSSEGETLWVDRREAPREVCGVYGVLNKAQLQAQAFKGELAKSMPAFLSVRDTFGECVSILLISLWSRLIRTKSPGLANGQRTFRRLPKG